MTSFVHVDQPTQHPGVVRAERAVQTLTHIARSFEGTRGGASLLLAAIVASLLVVAGQVVDSWTEGHLLVAWIVLWTVAFAALAVFAVPARLTAVRLGAGLKRAAAARRQAAEDRKFWQVALTDARVMADISRAMDHAGRDLRAYY